MPLRNRSPMPVAGRRLRIKADPTRWMRHDVIYLSAAVDMPHIRLPHGLGRTPKI